jgi:arginase
MRHIDAADIQSKGGTAAAQSGLAYVHADAHEFVLHLDTDVIAVDEFSAVNVPGAGGLPLADVRAALSEFAKHKNLLGLVVAQYNPDKDPDGSAAKKLVDLLIETLSARVEAPTATAAEPAGSDAPAASSPETTA